jgi:hypothetical protein
VYDRIIAIDDFMTFKTIMVKRNLQLQLESLQSYNTVTEELSRQEREEEEMVKAALSASLNESGSSEAELVDEKMNEILQQSLLEMELLHRQHEVDQLELERALAMSLLLEEERLNLKKLETKIDELRELADSSEEKVN